MEKHAVILQGQHARRPLPRLHPGRGRTGSLDTPGRRADPVSGRSGQRDRGLHRVRLPRGAGPGHRGENPARHGT